MKNTVVIIPALNPLPSLVQYVEKLSQLDIHKIIVINDGSDEKYEAVFDELRKIEDCIVLKHQENRGKGRALKTGFHYVIQELKKAQLVVTVGAHGQHSVEDVKQMIHNAKIFSDGFILGVRNFRSPDVTFGNTIGNRAVSLLFRLFFHIRLLDTQTGLRCIPKQELFWLVNVPGESFSYDTNMLIEAINRKIPIYEIPIGRLKIKKNSIMYYDEVTNMKKVIQHIISSYTKTRKNHKK